LHAQPSRLVRFLRIQAVRFLVAILALSCFNECRSPSENYTKYVNLFIGTQGGGILPAAQAPFKSLKISPVTTLPESSPNPYQYDYPYFYGFYQSNYLLDSLRYLSACLIQPYSGAIHYNPDSTRSRYSLEQAAPGFYKVLLDNHRVTASVTVSGNMAAYQFDFSGGDGNINLNLFQGLETVYRSTITWENDSTFLATILDCRPASPDSSSNLYLAGQFSRKPRHLSYQAPYQDETASDSLVVACSFSLPEEGSMVELRLVSSTESMAAARVELNSQRFEKSFSELRVQTNKKWNDVLRHIVIESDSDEKKEQFYSAVYQFVANLDPHRNRFRWTIEYPLAKWILPDSLFAIFDNHPVYSIEKDTSGSNGKVITTTSGSDSIYLRYCHITDSNYYKASDFEIAQTIWDGYNRGFFTFNSNDLYRYPTLLHQLGENFYAQQHFYEVTRSKFSLFPNGFPPSTSISGTAAWYVFAFLGIVPVNGQEDSFISVAPHVPSAIIHCANGTDIRIQTDHSDPHMRSMRFVNSVLQNGDSLEGTVFQLNPENSTQSLRINTSLCPSGYNHLEKAEGMLYGSFLGDAIGGPPEFQPTQSRPWTKPGVSLTDSLLAKMSNALSLNAYKRIAEPFGVWEDFAPAGSITDDSRWKIIYFDMIRYRFEESQNGFMQATKHFIDGVKPSHRGLADRWYREYSYLYANQDSVYGKVFLPGERIWGGVSTIMGQMAFLPLAIKSPYQKWQTYREAWELNPFDQGFSRDINSALVTGVAAAMEPGASWQRVENVMRSVDPYFYQNVPWVPRQVNLWLDSAHVFARRSDGSLQTLYSLLESRTQAKQWWDAWLPLVIVFSIAEITEYHPRAMMQAVVDFGHDTDSYLQVMGAILGALHGKTVFPEHWRRQLDEQLQDQYGVTIPEMASLLVENSRYQREVIIK